jgi:hypothetical protein
MVAMLQAQAMALAPMQPGKEVTRESSPLPEGLRFYREPDGGYRIVMRRIIEEDGYDGAISVEPEILEDGKRLLPSIVSGALPRGRLRMGQTYEVSLRMPRPSEGTTYLSVSLNVCQTWQEGIFCTTCSQNSLRTFFVSLDQASEP